MHHNSRLSANCCCHRILFNQPDFKSIESLLQIACKAWGFQVIFLPKFHCKLNFIEQCWGYVKHLYRLNPESSWENHLEMNALAALDAVPLDCMHRWAVFSLDLFWILILRCRFSNRSQKFMDAYAQGLNGWQAAWATRKYKGHRMLPETIMNEIENANIV